MIVIIGKTASGKDTICRKLLEKGYKKMITYTTRPIRPGERDGDTYHFITKDDFLNKIANDFFAEWKVYNTIDGDWYYGSAKVDYFSAGINTIIILTPDGYKDICNALDWKFKSIYIDANDETIKRRLMFRGDDRDEATRRLEHDTVDFAGFENVADFVVQNNWNDDIYEIVEKIDSKIREWGFNAWYL